jgi:hypothetical protein
MDTPTVCRQGKESSREGDKNSEAPIKGESRLLDPLTNAVRSLVMGEYKGYKIKMQQHSKNENETEANARAKTLIYLRENRLSTGVESLPFLAEKGDVCRERYCFL